MRNSNICMVTVTTDDYLQWSMTMIFSFLKSNQWFKGDIILVCSNLSEESKSMVSVFPSVRFRAPSQQLLEKVDELGKKIPAFIKLAPLFYSLEIFNFTQYDKVLFLDSDMLVIKSLEDVFGLNELFLASAESCWYYGKGRRTDTYGAVQHYADSETFIENPVNSGFLLVDKQLLHEGHYDKLIEMIKPDLWENKNTFHADQLIINLYFKGRIKLLDAKHNFRPNNAEAIFAKDGFAFEDVKIIHYFRQYKPWNFKEVLALSQYDMLHLRAFELWYQYYTEFLKFYHLQLRFNQLKKKDATDS